MKSNNIEVMTYDNANELIEDIFKSLLWRYQISLETLIKSSGLIFNGVTILQMW